MEVMAKKQVAWSVLVTFIAWTVIFGFSARLARGATLTSMSDTLSDSDTGVASNHTIKFTTPTGVSAGQTITYTFGTATTTTGFSSSSIAALGLEDFDFVIGSTEQSVTSTASCSGATTVRITTSTSASTSSITVEICTSNSVAASASTTLEVGTNATSGGTGNSQITNPSTAGSYEITVGGTMTDSGALRVAIIDDVNITATVGTSLTFSISGVNSGESCVGATTNATSTATAITFGTLSTAASSTACQQLSVSTNAANGFVVTVQADQTLRSGNGADIDFFRNGDADATPVAWVTPSSTLGTEATYGHWGVTTADTNLSTDTGVAADNFGTYNYAGNFASSTPRNIFAHTGPANATTTHVGITIQIGALQEAANDYTAILTYIATPTF